MREFIKGWQRKIGLLTLVMACLIVAVWMISISNDDLINRQISRLLPETDDGISLFTDGHSISLVRYEKSISNSESSPPVADSPEFLKAAENEQPVSEDKDESPNVVMAPTTTVRIVCMNLTSLIDIPYWSIVLLLTAVSAFLLLFKSRNSIQTKVTDPVRVEARNDR